MAIGQSRNGRATSVPIGLISGAAMSMMATTVLAALGAIMISKEWLAQEQMGVWAMGTLVMSAMAGSMTAAARIKRLKVQMALLNGACYFLMLICLALFVFRGKPAGLGTTFVLVLIGSITGGLLTIRERRVGKGGRRKKLHR